MQESQEQVVRDEEELTWEDLVTRAEQRATLLFEGVRVAHRSCGITMAETFGLRTAPYQSLRRGGITGCGECGAIRGGELVLGELLGDPDPTGTVTPALRTAAHRYRALWQERVQREGVTSIVCNDLTGRFEDFASPARREFCTKMAATAAACAAQALAEAGVRWTHPPEPVA